ncbi:hypothetical protein PR048_032289 [Dryococelus australis]|uniref:Uncharacterized protein n=1 Tax=Dryococelus australis TaxID=614101 RepID=A0ABQ9G5Y7_9NEOP|nr:hypothetical protein PR048_032289 [Dryococelus australis]
MDQRLLGLTNIQCRKLVSNFQTHTASITHSTNRQKWQGSRSNFDWTNYRFQSSTTRNIFLFYFKEGCSFKVLLFS